jgi:hypothetical protein
VWIVGGALHKEIMAVLRTLKYVQKAAQSQTYTGKITRVAGKEKHQPSNQNPTRPPVKNYICITICTFWFKYLQKTAKPSTYAGEITRVAGKGKTPTQQPKTSPAPGYIHYDLHFLVFTFHLITYPLNFLSKSSLYLTGSLAFSSLSFLPAGSFFS